MESDQAVVLEDSPRIRKRGASSAATQQQMARDDAPGAPAPPLDAAAGTPMKGSADDKELEATIKALPSVLDQLGGIRSFVCGTVLGVLFAVITLKLSLGSAGIIPSLNVPAGLLSFALLKGWALGAKTRVAQNSPTLERLLFKPFGVQENAVLQTFILSISGVAFTGGFGTYLTGMSYQAYLNTGGKPVGTPEYEAARESIYDPVAQRTIPYLLMTAVLGVFMLTQMRKLMIIDWRLPFPSGTASGIMLTSFHTATGEAAAMRKVRWLLWTGLASLLFSVFKWVFQGTDYGCGFSVWPTFGLLALKYTWNIDFQQNYIGSGMICPHIVNWSMLLGAILSWGLMWPLLEKREGDWYPAKLDKHSFEGIFGYKVFLTIAILMGEGLYMVGRVMVSSGRDIRKRYTAFRAASMAKRRSKSGALELPPAEQRTALGARSTLKALAAGNGVKGADTPVLLPSDVSGGSTVPLVAHVGPLEAEEVVVPAAPAAAQEERHLLEFKESEAERKLRTEVFLREVIPWWLAPLGYGGLGVLATICIPLIYPPVKWYYVLVAYVITPLFALPNSYGTGLTDWDNCSMYGKLALFIFAAWAGASGNGVIVGLGICGVVFGATSSAATLMGDFRTGYICLTAPRAMFVAQLVGQALGALLCPVAFLLFYNTHQVNVPNGPYPAPFSDIYRSMAMIGIKGFSALPKYCGVLMLAFFLAGILLSLIRDLLPPKYARFVPSPMAMGIPFYIGASSAIDFWLGSVVMHVWEWWDKESASELGVVVGAGLLVGDGVWAIPSSIMAMAGALPPVCLGFYGPPTCSLPYCATAFLGSSEQIPK